MRETAAGPQGFPIERTIDGYDYVSLIAVKFTLERVKELEQRLKEAEEVIRFYADKKDWDNDDYRAFKERVIFEDDLEECEHGIEIGGKRARTYLNKHKGAQG